MPFIWFLLAAVPGTIILMLSFGWEMWYVSLALLAGDALLFWYALDRTMYKVKLFSDGTIVEYRLSRPRRVVKIDEVTRLTLKIYMVPALDIPAAVLPWLQLENPKYDRFPFLPVSREFAEKICSLRPDLGEQYQAQLAADQNLEILNRHV